MTFWKSNEFKALVQMETIPQAEAAQAALDGRDSYTGCNMLNICFSKHPELRVRFNNDRSRDYTNPDLPEGPPHGEAGGYDPIEQDPRSAGMLGDAPPPQAEYYDPIPPPPHGGEYGGGRDYGGYPGAGGPPPAAMDPPPSRYRPEPRDQRYDEGPPRQRGGFIPGQGGPESPSPVLICSNLDPVLVVSCVTLLTMILN